MDVTPAVAGTAAARDLVDAEHSPAMWAAGQAFLDADQAAGGITSPFGMRYHPILHYRKLHTGIDFDGGGSTVRSADDGRVLMTVVSEAYGNFTVIDHGVIDGHRITTAYAHQSQFLVREGQRVRKGQAIGVIGSTGYSTGPHLHFEVRRDRSPVDPMTWLTR